MNMEGTVHYDCNLLGLHGEMKMVASNWEHKRWGLSVDLQFGIWLGSLARNRGNTSLENVL